MHAPVNRSVLQQETSRTAIVSNHAGGRSSIGSHDHRFHQDIVFHAYYKVDNIGRLTTSVAPKFDDCPRR